MFKTIFSKFFKKDIDTKSIKSFNSALKVIKEFILLKDFNKVYLAIDEIISKENNAFLKIQEKISEKDKNKYLSLLHKRIKKIEDLRKNAKKEEKKYIEYKKEREFKFNKKQLEKDLKKHIGQKEYDICFKKINDFFEKYKTNTDVLYFIDNKRKNIQKIIKKENELKAKEIKNDSIQEIRDLVGDIVSEKQIEENIEKSSFFKKIYIDKLKSYFTLRKRIIDKKLLDEVEFLIKKNDEQKKQDIEKRLSNIHSGITKEINNKNINGYDIYGKILGADKISGDSIGFIDRKKDYVFYLGDATGHGLRAGFIITKLTKKFDELKEKLSFLKICFEINNSLKQDLKSGNFITSVFFNIDKKDNQNLNFVGMGHEPMFLYRKKTNDIQKIIPGGLAAGIRLLKKEEDIKPKKIIMEDGDILICYTDGITEAKNNDGEMYSIDRLGNTFKNLAKNDFSLKDLYNSIISDLKEFRGGNTNFYDDVSILLLKRDIKNDFITDDKRLESIIRKEGLEINLIKKIKGKQIGEIKKDILKIKKEKELKNILKILDALYKTGEYPKLKQDCIRYIKEGFIHKKINFFLKKSIENEENFKINQKNKRLHDKYNVLNELYNKGDYDTVIKEIVDIITKEGNI